MMIILREVLPLRLMEILQNFEQLSWQSKVCIRLHVNPVVIWDFML